MHNISRAKMAIYHVQILTRRDVYIALFVFIKFAHNLLS